jgi:hypothetical protein
MLSLVGTSNCDRYHGRSWNVLPADTGALLYMSQLQLIVALSGSVLTLLAVVWQCIYLCFVSFTFTGDMDYNLFGVTL